MAAARLRKQPLFITQCTADTRPEDLLVTPVLAESGKIAYHASPLVSAMLVGGVCVLDEGNRMNEKSWASLAPLLDHRRYVESVVAGITIHAHADCRVCVTMNEDESTYEVPDYILSRLQPTLALGFPTRDDELAILKYHLPFAEAELLALTVEFLQQAHKLKLDFSPARRAQHPAVTRSSGWRRILRIPWAAMPPGARPFTACSATRPPTSRTSAAASGEPWAGSMLRLAWETCSSTPMIRCTLMPGEDEDDDEDPMEYLHAVLGVLQVPIPLLRTQPSVSVVLVPSTQGVWSCAVSGRWSRPPGRPRRGSDNNRPAWSAGPGRAAR